MRKKFAKLERNAINIMILKIFCCAALKFSESAFPNLTKWAPVMAWLILFI